MTTNFKIASRVSLPFTLLLSATLFACVSEVPVEEGAAVDGTAGETEAARLAGDGDGSGASRVAAPEKTDNSAPCGDQTIAVVHSSAGSVYAFCGLGGKTGVLEELPSGDVRESLLDVFESPADLLRAVAPEGTALPDHLIASVEAGVVAEDQRSLYPLKLGLPSLATPLSGGYCASTAQFYYDHAWSASWIPFMEEFVVDAESCEMHLWENSGSGQVTWHQHTASSYQVYNELSPPWAGACGAKEHVLSCGGSTLFEAFRQEATGNPWVSALSYWVSANAVATWKMYASGCSPYQDRDDMRFTGNSEPGASHHYTTLFLKWLDGVSCVYD